MNTSTTRHLDFLSEIGEMKRIYSVIENSLLKNNSLCLEVTSGLPNEGKTTIVAGLAAIAAGQRKLRVLAVLEWFDPSFKSERQIAQYLELPILGSIPDLNKISAALHSKP